MSRYKNIIFDVGSVLVNWMRMNLYTTLFQGDREKAKWIIDHVVTNEWNDQTDLGKPIDECIFELKQAFCVVRNILFLVCFPPVFLAVSIFFITFQHLNIIKSNSYEIQMKFSTPALNHI